ncbi:MAG TPA: ABC transporter permease [Mycobacteriales bacterium]|nr:ABC transporter permease [Mycobacteriales bacterium]
MASTVQARRPGGPVRQVAGTIAARLPLSSHPTVRYAVSRLLASIGLLFVASIVIFLLEHLAPGSPESVLLGGRPATPQLLAAIRREYHLDAPLWTQYWDWLTGVLHGNFGQSITYKASVSSVIGSRIGATLELGVYAALITTVIGVTLGAVAALRSGRFTDTAISTLVVVLSSISGYVSAIVLLVIFGVKLGWFPILGTGTSGTDRLYHLTLPAIALAISLIALIARTTRASVGRTLDVEFVDTARSRGLSERRIFVKHVFRNSLIPILTVSGLAVGYLISGAVLVEYTFGLNGLGSLLVQAVEAKDYAVVQGVALLFTAVFIAVNLIIDLLYGLVDPRVRIGEVAA